MGGLKRIPTLQIVGFKNSGKTTLIQSVTEGLTGKGYQIGVIKHHGHGGKPASVDPPETDSARFRQAGAVAATVAGEGTIQLQADVGQKAVLSMLIDWYRQLPLDLILIEGYKQADYPKIALFNGVEEREQLSRLPALIAMIGDSEEGVKNNIQTFLNKPDDYIPFIEDYIKRS